MTRVLMLLIGMGLIARAGELEIYVDLSPSPDRGQLRQILQHAETEIAKAVPVTVRVIGFYGDGWNAPVSGEVSLPAAAPQLKCAPPQFSDLGKISRAQRVREEEAAKRVCAQQGGEVLKRANEETAEARRFLHEIIESTLSRKETGRCTDLNGVLARMARSKATVAWLISDMVEDCAKTLSAPVAAGARVFISPVQPVGLEPKLTSGEYFETVVTKMGRIAPWARVIPGSFDLSELFVVLTGRTAAPGGMR